MTSTSNKQAATTSHNVNIPNSAETPGTKAPAKKQAASDMTPDAREHEIVKASVIGIAGNMLLVAFKMIIGFFSHSIAIILDGVNNATDALSSIITIVGTKVAGRPPDGKHPFGYGRIEYLTSVVIAVIILVAGALSLRESILKIIHPATPSYSTLTITIIVVAILGKIVLGVIFKHCGDKTSCEALIASGVDSNYDAVLSAGTLVVALAQNIWNINIDGLVGVIISLVVCKAGIEVLHDALAPIIGTPEDRQRVADIKRYIRTFPNVCDVHNVILDNFGPNKVIGSVYIDVPDSLTARQVGELTRSIAKGLQKKFNVELTVGIRTDNTTPEFAPMKNMLDELAKEVEGILNVHAFYVDPETKTCYFDMVVKLKANSKKAKDDLITAMQKRYPDFTFDVQVEVDYAE